jgi:hypothetical protein
MFHPFTWYSISHEAENEKYLILVGIIDSFVLHEIDDIGKLELLEFLDICKQFRFDSSFLAIRNGCNWCWWCNPWTNGSGW